MGALVSTIETAMEVLREIIEFLSPDAVAKIRTQQARTSQRRLLSEMRAVTNISYHDLQKRSRKPNNAQRADQMLIELYLRLKAAELYGGMDRPHRKFWWEEASRWSKISRHTSSEIRNQLRSVVMKIHMNKFRKTVRMPFYQYLESCGCLFDIGYFEKPVLRSPFGGGFDPLAFVFEHETLHPCGLLLNV
jgi:hypothetical protein